MRFYDNCDLGSNTNAALKKINKDQKFNPTCCFGSTEDTSISLMNLIIEYTSDGLAIKQVTL